MYSPKIKPELVKELYRLKHSKQKKKTPMTKLVNEAVSEYLERNNDKTRRASEIGSKTQFSDNQGA